MIRACLQRGTRTYGLRRDETFPLVAGVVAAVVGWWVVGAEGVEPSCC